MDGLNRFEKYLSRITTKIEFGGHISFSRWSHSGMELSKSQILEIINNSVRSEDIKRSFIYWYKKTLRQGEIVRIGPQTFAMPFEGTIVFVDLAPRSNWAHPCFYVLVDNKTLDTKLIEASLPPNIDQSDESYIIILRFGQKPPHERYFSAFDE